MRGADQRRAVRWAEEVISAGEFVVLDSETTGLKDPVGFVEIAVSDRDGNALVNTTVRPRLPARPGSTATPRRARPPLPTFRKIYPEKLDAIGGRHVLVLVEVCEPYARNSSAGKRPGT